MTSSDKQRSVDALKAAASKAIKFGYLDLAAQIMFVAETLQRSEGDNLVELPPTVLTFKRDAANY